MACRSTPSAGAVATGSSGIDWGRTLENLLWSLDTASGNRLACASMPWMCEMQPTGSASGSVG